VSVKANYQEVTSHLDIIAFHGQARTLLQRHFTTLRWEVPPLSSLRLFQLTTPGTQSTAIARHLQRSESPKLRSRSYYQSIPEPTGLLKQRGHGLSLRIMYLECTALRYNGLILVLFHLSFGVAETYCKLFIDYRTPEQHTWLLKLRLIRCLRLIAAAAVNTTCFHVVSESAPKEGVRASLGGRCVHDLIPTQNIRYHAHRRFVSLLAACLLAASRNRLMQLDIRASSAELMHL